MKILIWAIEQDFEVVETKAVHLLDTARQFNINVETLGIGHTFTNFRDRLHILQDYLKTIDPEDIVLVMDAYDTLFNSTSEVIFHKFKSKNTRILISAEKMYTYQYHQFMHKYDTIESEYRVDLINASLTYGVNVEKFDIDSDYTYQKMHQAVLSSDSILLATIKDGLSVDKIIDEAELLIETSNL